MHGYLFKVQIERKLTTYEEGKSLFPTPSRQQIMRNKCKAALELTIYGKKEGFTSLATTATMKN